jgi:hypothetical protein
MKSALRSLLNRSTPVGTDRHLRVEEDLVASLGGAVANEVGQAFVRICAALV